jgi:hypothetical protein
VTPNACIGVLQNNPLRQCRQITVIGLLKIKYYILFPDALMGKNNLQLHYTPLVKTQAAAVGACNGKKR